MQHQSSHHGIIVLLNSLPTSPCTPENIIDLHKPATCRRDAVYLCAHATSEVHVYACYIRRTCVCMLHQRYMCVHATSEVHVCACYIRATCVCMLHQRYMCVHATSEVHVCACYIRCTCVCMLHQTYMCVHATSELHVYACYIRATCVCMPCQLLNSYLSCDVINIHIRWHPPSNLQVQKYLQDHPTANSSANTGMNDSVGSVSSQALCQGTSMRPVSLATH